MSPIYTLKIGTPNSKILLRIKWLELVKDDVAQNSLEKLCRRYKSEDMRSGQELWDNIKSIVGKNL
uniref:Uncharacterized protein n=1 Tax=Megaselia scalaris TaxID=36166 RepID=T1GN35_MEGSC